MHITDEQIQNFNKNGYIFLGDIILPDQLSKLQQRASEYMNGKRSKKNMFFHMDTDSGRYEDVEHVNTRFSGPSDNYRKLKDLEYDEEFLAFYQNETIKSVCQALIGNQVSSMRAMIMNKPAQGGTILPYHQDLCVEWPMSKPPRITFWFALDDATIENGCLEVIPGSHVHGVIGNGHMITKEDEKKYVSPYQSTYLPLKAGQGIVFHCGLLHRSGINQTNQSRRGLTICMLDGNTINTRRNTHYPIIFGDNALTPEKVATIEEIPFEHAS